MAELKTKRTDASVEDFLGAIVDECRQRDCRTVLKMMKRATKSQPRMWGASIVGFGSTHYKYASGREGDWFLVGFSPRKTDLTLYLMGGFEGNRALLKRLGKYRTGKCCLYLKKLTEVDPVVLEQMIKESVKKAGRVNT